jgi:hypothetical protein
MSADNREDWGRIEIYCVDDFAAFSLQRNESVDLFTCTITHVHEEPNNFS